MSLFSCGHMRAGVEPATCCSAAGCLLATASTVHSYIIPKCFFDFEIFNDTAVRHGNVYLVLCIVLHDNNTLNRFKTKGISVVAVQQFHICCGLSLLSVARSDFRNCVVRKPNMVTCHCSSSVQIVIVARGLVLVYVAMCIACIVCGAMTTFVFLYKCDHLDTCHLAQT